MAMPKVLLIGSSILAAVVLQHGSERQQTSSVPYQEAMGPSFSNVAVRFSYAGSYPSMRGINFKDFSVQLFDRKGRPAGIVRLRNGRYEKKEPLGYEALDLQAFYYLTPVGTRGAEYGLLMLSENGAGGSSHQERIAQVLELSSNQLRVVQQLERDEHFGGPFPAHHFDESTKTLVMATAHYMPGDAHCCVSAMDVVSLRWKGSRFVQASMKTELTDSGRSEGKKLNR